MLFFSSSCFDLATAVRLPFPFQPLPHKKGALIPQDPISKARVLEVVLNQQIALMNQTFVKKSTLN